VNDDDWYFAALVYYIHLNRVKHGISNDYETYQWSSYSKILDTRPSLLQKDKILAWFGGREKFIAFHKGNPDIDKINDLMLD
jgi:putative transposase